MGDDPGHGHGQGFIEVDFGLTVFDEGVDELRTDKAGAAAVAAGPHGELVALPVFGKLNRLRLAKSRVPYVAMLTCISHHPTVEARDTTAMTSLRLLAVLNVLFKYACARQAARASS